MLLMFFYAHYTGEPALAGIASLELEDFSEGKTYWACMPMLMPVSTFGLKRRHRVHSIVSVPTLLFLILVFSCLQCFDAVGWAAGRASGL